MVEHVHGQGNVDVFGFLAAVKIFGRFVSVLIPENIVSVPAKHFSQVVALRARMWRVVIGFDVQRQPVKFYIHRHLTFAQVFSAQGRKNLSVL